LVLIGLIVGSIALYVWRSRKTGNFEVPDA